MSTSASAQRWTPDPTGKPVGLCRGLPAIPTGQNGSGTAATVVEVFDDLGNLTWAKDERGFITRHKYWVYNTSRTHTIEDVNTALVSDEPSGWATPSGGGLHLEHEFRYDLFARVLNAFGPSHEAVVAGTWKPSDRPVALLVLLERDLQDWLCGRCRVNPQLAARGRALTVSPLDPKLKCPASRNCLPRDFYGYPGH